MAEAYKKAKLITTAAGFTSASGFVGIQNVHNAVQNVTISGPFIYNQLGVRGGDIGISMAVGQIIPVNCNNIRPTSGNVLGFLP
jgi:hypothetical protein